MRISRNRVFGAVKMSGGAAILGGGGAECFLDDLVGQVAASAAREVAAHRAIGGFAVTAATVGRGPDIAIANHIAGADDHRVDVALLRRVRKYGC